MDLEGEMRTLYAAVADDDVVLATRCRGRIVNFYSFQKEVATYVRSVRMWCTLGLSRSWFVMVQDAKILTMLLQAFPNEYDFQWFTSDPLVWRLFFDCGANPNSATVVPNVPCLLEQMAAGSTLRQNEWVGKEHTYALFECGFQPTGSQQSAFDTWYEGYLQRMAVWRAALAWCILPAPQLYLLTE